MRISPLRTTNHLKSRKAIETLFVKQFNEHRNSPTNHLKSRKAIETIDYLNLHTILLLSLPTT